MDVNCAGNLLSGRAGIAVEQVLRPQRDAGDAEAALHAGGGDETAREQVAVGGIQSLERQDVVTAGRRHGATTFAWPSKSTRQQPHWPCGAHPSLGEVIPSRSRSTLSSDSPGAAPTVTAWPLQSKEIVATAARLRGEIPKPRVRCEETDRNLV
jgi:hypothetical protein